MPDKYVPYAIEINATIIDQITSRSFELGHEVQTLRGDGNVDEHFATIIASRPRFTLTTTALAKALTVCGFGGLDLSSGADIWFQKVAAKGTRAGSSSHTRVTYSDGLLLPRRISASQGQIATMEFEGIATSDDGTTAPMSIATSASLAGSPGTTEAFTLGPVSVGGSTLAGVTEVEVDFGIEEALIESDGGVYPRDAYINARRPRISIKTTNVAELTSTDFQKADPVGATDTVITFYKLAEDGTLAGSGDKTITIDQGIMRVVEGGGDEDSGDLLTLEIIPTYDGTNAVLVIA